MFYSRRSPRGKEETTCCLPRLYLFDFLEAASVENIIILKYVYIVAIIVYLLSIVQINSLC